MSKWISTKDRLPVCGSGAVLIYNARHKKISIAERTINNRWQGHAAIKTEISHWMPLPEPPEVQE